VLNDSAANVKLIQSSDLDWTIVRYPRLADGERTRQYRAGYLGKDSGNHISRSDGADFVLTELTARQWLRKAPIVSY
jgi:hypothetical protein